MARGFKGRGREPSPNETLAFTQITVDRSLISTAQHPSLGTPSPQSCGSAQKAMRDSTDAKHPLAGGK